MLEATGEKLSPGHEIDATVRRSHGEDEARRILVAARNCLALGEEKFAELKKSDPRKAVAAALMRERTAVSNAWIAKAVGLGHVSRVYQCARHAAAEEGLRKKILDELKNGCDS